MKDAASIAKHTWQIICRRGPFVAGVVALAMSAGLFVRSVQAAEVAERTPPPAKFQLEADATIHRINAVMLLMVPLFIAGVRYASTQRRPSLLDDVAFYD
ncbi:MAG: hypothetical protein ACO1SV_10225 [Fimbriimonas sp.]